MSQDGRVGPLLHSQDEARNDDRWQPGDGLTWCNQAMYDVAEANGLDIGDLYEEGGRGWTLANQFIANLNAAIGLGSDITTRDKRGEAQMKADVGYTVIAARANPNGHGHVATVRPGGEYSGARGPTVSNVGSKLASDLWLNTLVRMWMTLGITINRINSVEVYQELHGRFNHDWDIFLCSGYGVFSGLSREEFG